MALVLSEAIDHQACHDTSTRAIVQLDATHTAQKRQSSSTSRRQIARRGTRQPDLSV